MKLNFEHFFLNHTRFSTDSRGDIAGNDEDFEFEEMSVQENQFFSMSYEFMEMETGANTTQLLLKYCPDSFYHLLDRCLIKKNNESDQVMINLIVFRIL